MEKTSTNMPQIYEEFTYQNLTTNFKEKLFWCYIDSASLTH